MQNEKINEKIFVFLKNIVVYLHQEVVFDIQYVVLLQLNNLFLHQIVQLIQQNE
jgi:hypothetical protein